MPGRGTEPGPALYEECGSYEGVLRHRRESTRTCAGCREVQRVGMHQYRVQRIIAGRKMVSTLGLRRRVHALATRGWAQRDIAERLGTSAAAFSKIVNQDETHRDTADKVKAVYAELAWQDGPNALARRKAELKGWPGPMDWDDPDNPDEVPLCVIERDHREALRIESNRRKNETRRAVRRRWAGSRAQEVETEMMSA